MSISASGHPTRPEVTAFKFGAQPATARAPRSNARHRWITPRTYPSSERLGSESRLTMLELLGKAREFLDAQRLAAAAQVDAGVTGARLELVGGSELRPRVAQGFAALGERGADSGAKAIGFDGAWGAEGGHDDDRGVDLRAWLEGAPADGEGTSYVEGGGREDGESAVRLGAGCR